MNRNVKNTEKQSKKEHMRKMLKKGKYKKE